MPKMNKHKKRRHQQSLNNIFFCPRQNALKRARVQEVAWMIFATKHYNSRHLEQLSRTSWPPHPETVILQTTCAKNVFESQVQKRCIYRVCLCFRRHETRQLLSRTVCVTLADDLRKWPRQKVTKHPSGKQLCQEESLDKTQPKKEHRVPIWAEANPWICAPQSPMFPGHPHEARHNLKQLHNNWWRNGNPETLQKPTFQEKKSGPFLNTWHGPFSNKISKIVSKTTAYIQICT